MKVKTQIPNSAEQEKSRQQLRHMAGICCKAAYQLPSVPCHNLSGFLAIDLETTGLETWDEILKISILDGDEHVLLDSYVRPYYTENWPAAQRINGISPEDVKDAPYLHQLVPQIRGAFESAHTLILYNADFDLGKLSLCGEELFRDKQIFDVMWRFALIYGQEDSCYCGGYRPQSLTTCASYFGYSFHAHDSLEDAKATLFCCKAIMVTHEQSRMEPLLAF